MTIYFKSRGIWVQHVPNWLSKNPSNSGFFFSNEHEFITSWVMWLNLFILYVVRHNAITQRPYGHLFQKSGHLGATCAELAQ